jgi:hypothetical protein
MQAFAVALMYHSLMGPLKNARRERFCLALAEGMSQAAAYVRAGYKETASSNANAARLIAIDSVAARLAELKAEAAANSKITAESLIKELEHARQRADSLDQIAASVAAIKTKAMIAGISEQRIRVTHERPEPPETTVEDIAAWAAAHWELGSVQLNEMQKREFGLLMRDVIAKIEDFLSPIRAANAKTVPALSPPQIIEHERRRLGLPKV